MPICVNYSMHLLILGFVTTILVYTNGEYIEPGPKYPCPHTRILLHPCKCIRGNDVGVTVQCENSNLASLAIGLTNLAAVRLPIENLVISSCNFSYVYGDLFHSFNMKNLLLENVPLADMNKEIFLGAGKSIKSMKLLNTKLSSVPTDALARITDLKILNISSHTISSISQDLFPEVIRNSLERLSISNGNVSTIYPETFIHFKKLKTLDLHGNSISQLQKNQFKGMKEIELLDLSFNRIAKIDPAHFSELTKMSHLNLSHNLLTDLPRAAFAKNTIMRILNLGFNNLKRLDGNMFRGLHQLKVLFLNDNQMTRIEKGTIDTFQRRIAIIDLSGNRLTSVDYQMFNDMRSIEKIDLSRNQITKIENHAFKSIYMVEINLSKNNISVIERGAFEECINITKLDFSYNSISSFPKYSFDEATYATELHLEFNNLMDLSEAPLSNMTGLKVLNVSNNRLMTIPKNTFPKLFELHTIDLSNNYINDCAPEVFQPLFGLRYLNLSQNQLDHVSGRTFGKIPTLLQLSLRGNYIKSITKDAFTYLISLQDLDLSSNAIESVISLSTSMFYLNLSDNAISQIEPGKTWPTMNTLVTLDLSYNYLADSLEKDAFANLLVLQRLNLAYNNITEPPKDSLKDLTSLRYLDMRGNLIVSLPKSAFGELPVVFELNLADNLITEIENKAFVGLLQLRDLDLSRNNISNIPNDVFAGLVALSTLDLSQNQIDSIDNKSYSIFEECRSLKMLNMSRNLISTLGKNSFPSQETIKIADFSYNQIPMLTVDFTNKMKKVQYLNFSHNHINEITTGVFENLTSLISMNLGFNELNSIAPLISSFRLPQNLSELLLDHNLLQRLPIKAISNHNKLKILDIRHNLLPFFIPEFMKLIENGTYIYFSENPIVCNCNIRPLQRWMSSQLKIPSEFEEITCVDSEELTTSKKIFTMTEYEMPCDPFVLSKNSDFDITPDVKFRDVTRTKDGTLIISWYVPKNKDDIANFILETVNKTNREQVFYKKSLPYYVRNEILKPRFPITDETEVCLVATTSGGIQRNLLPNQCRNLASVLPRSSATSSNLDNSVMRSSCIGVVVLFIHYITLLKCL